MQKRIGYIDMAKGLAIILVIIGHITFTPKTGRTIVYLFHIPLFFFLSGFTFSIDKYKNFRSFFWNKFKGIVVPFVLMNVFVFLVQLFILYPDQVLSFNVIHFTTQLLFSDRLHIYFQLWFLNVLFLSEIVCYFVLKYAQEVKVQIAVVVCLMLLVFIGQKAYEANWYLIWNWDLVPVSSIFVLLGFLTRKNIDVIERFLTLKFLPIAIFISITTGLLNDKMSGFKVDLFYQQIGNHFLFYIAAISGIWATITLFKVIPEVEWFKSIGKKTLIYYGVHSPIVLVLVEKLVAQLASKYTGIFINGYVTTAFTTFLTVIGCEIIVRIFKGTNFPFGIQVLGEKNE
ncbi:acyltransferase family protein [Abiotrophia defectiva]|jgi:putative O-acetyl transferase|uniref:acyltransferase family protein n=1 Tax=Abiotrophia defectiva TaxID=46125 RepID=UPI0028D8E29D|nr:acyltransferase family protein [Abiotrophia defectiva]